MAGKGEFIFNGIIKVLGEDGAVTVSIRKFKGKVGEPAVLLEEWAIPEAEWQAHADKIFTAASQRMINQINI